MESISKICKFALASTIAVGLPITLVTTPFYATTLFVKGVFKKKNATNGHANKQILTEEIMKKVENSLDE